jgi:hypothetical protein
MQRKGNVSFDMRSVSKESLIESNSLASAYNDFLIDQVSYEADPLN